MQLRRDSVCFYEEKKKKKVKQQGNEIWQRDKNGYMDRHFSFISLFVMESQLKSMFPWRDETYCTSTYNIVSSCIVHEILCVYCISLSITAMIVHVPGSTFTPSHSLCVVSPFNCFPYLCTRPSISTVYNVKS